MGVVVVSRRSKGAYTSLGPSAPSSLRVALFGDSLSDDFNYNLSPFYWINGLAAGGAFEVIANCGVAGETISDMAARVHNSWTNSSPGLAGLSLGVTVVEFGTNNVRAGNSWASVASAAASLLADIKSHCEHAYVLALTPIAPTESDSTTKNTRTIDYNVGLAALCAADPASYTFLATDEYLRNGDGTPITSTLNPDGVHPNGSGVYLQGIKGYEQIGPTWAAWSLSSPISTDAADVYPTVNQWVVNHVMAGAGGTVGGGWSGQMANNCAISSNGSGISGTVAKEAAAGGDPNQTPWQAISPTQVTHTGNGESIRVTLTLAGRTITTSDPSVLDVIVEFSFDAFDTNYFSSITMWMQGAGGSYMTEFVELKMGGAVITHDSVVLRLKMPRPSATAESGATLYMDFMISANRTASMGKVRFRNPQIWG